MPVGAYLPEGRYEKTDFRRIGALNADCLKAVLANDHLEINPRYVFSFSPKSAVQGDALFDVTAHLSQGALVLEMERTGRSEDSAPDYYGLIKGTAARLQASPTVRAFCEAIAEEMRKLTGLDRVMIYRFAEDHSGWVFAETRRDDLESFLDLHYPAEDIPKPAREIFTKITLRSLPDTRHVPAELVPLVNPDTNAPLNMTYCFLRGASKMYTDYLENMRVRMSLTMAILRDGHLWGMIDMILADTDLDGLLDEVFDLLAVSREEAHVEFRKPRPLPTVRCDPVRVRDLLLNLVSNAIKYNDSARRWVEVGYREECAQMIFHVKDNGISIDKKFHEQVFKMFKRLHGREEYGGGAGAGLSIARKIVERHGGRIWIDSALGEGTTFSFTLNAKGAA